MRSGCAGGHLLVIGKTDRSVIGGLSNSAAVIGGSSDANIGTFAMATILARSNSAARGEAPRAQSGGARASVRRPEQLRVALFSGNYNYVRDGANQALNKLV